MDSPLKTRKIGEGITFSSVTDKRFKTNRLSIHFITELKKDTVTVNALIPQVLKKGFKGCENFTLLNQRLQDLYGAYVEGDIQKRGDDQIMTLCITAIDDKFALNQEPVTARAADILCGMALHPLIEESGFNEKYVKLEKNALIDTIQAEMNEKRSYAINAMTAAMCEGEPYGLPKYGFEDAVGQITPRSAKEQYDDLIRSARIEVMFTGCGDGESAFAVFQDAFRNVERQYHPLPKITPHAVPAAGEAVRRKTEHMSVNQSKMVLGFGTGTGAGEETVPANRLMAAVLGGTPSSKLFVNVREKLSLCYYCAARYDTYKGLLIIDSGVENQNIEKAEKEILAQLDAVRQGDFTEEEYTSALLSLKNAYSGVY